MNCADCFYSHKGKSELFTDEMFCHRYPPIMMIWPKGGGEMSFTVDYPPVAGSEQICGEWRERLC